MRASSKIAFIGIGLFDEHTGISRAIQLMVEYFGPRAVVIVDNLQACRTHPIASGLVYVVNSPGLKLSIRRKLAREPLKLIDQYVKMTAGIFKILCHQEIERICCNTSVQFALLSPILLGIKAISRGMKITVFVYDPVEPSWCRKNLLARLLLWSGLASDIITVDVTMRHLLLKLTKRTPVHTVDFGVSAELVRLAGQKKDSIIDKVGSDLLASLARDTKSVILLFIGRALERRRLQDLIVAFAKLRNRDDPKDLILYVGGYTTSDTLIGPLKTMAARLGCLGKMRQDQPVPATSRMKGRADANCSVSIPLEKFSDSMFVPKPHLNNDLRPHPMHSYLSALQSLHFRLLNINLNPIYTREALQIHYSIDGFGVDVLRFFE
jgi:glycosyltransferase involved in cell wall biosynthesis